MRDILVKIGQFFEAHVEKFVLGLVLTICIWVILTRVVFSPNRVTYDDRSFGAASIDEHIRTKYVDQFNMDGPATENHAPFKHRLDQQIDANDPVRIGVAGDLSGGFVQLLNGSLGHIDVARTMPIRRKVEDTGERRAYQLPEIGGVWDTDIEHLRAAAYVPTVALSDDVEYSASTAEPNDLDLVTVQAHFNAATLYRRFQDRFDSSNLPAKWRDKDLAIPVFGAVHLQRQEQQSDGTWGEWVDVPRIAIENRRQTFEIYETVDELPVGGMQVRLLELGRENVRNDLLQPSAYSMASAYEEWFPPTLHREYTDLYAKQKKQELRDERESNKNERAGTRSRRGNQNETRGGDVGGVTRNRGSRNRGGGPGEDMMAGGYGAEGQNQRNRNSRRGSQRGVAGEAGMEDMMYGMEDMGMGAGRDMLGPMAELYEKYDDVRLKRTTKLSEEESLLFWAHDDTVQPGKVYRYRIRLGVLNPVAGTPHMADEFSEYQSQVLLWSTFSEKTAAVSIPRREYIFAKTFNESTGTAEVDVKKYYLGYWRGSAFKVQPGETIGREIETREENRLDRQFGNEGMGMDMMMYGAVGAAEEITSDPATINFATDALFVDVERVDGWTGKNTLRPQIFYNMLYTLSGQTIERAAVGSSNWSNENRLMFAEINKAERMDKEEFKGFTSTQSMNQTDFGYRDYGMEGMMP